MPRLFARFASACLLANRRFAPCSGFSLEPCGFSACGENSGPPVCATPPSNASPTIASSSGASTNTPRPTSSGPSTPVSSVVSGSRSSSANVSTISDSAEFHM